MDKIIKALNRLTSKERLVIKTILLKIKDRKFYGLDIKKLKGQSDIFRIRKGKIRIIYKLDKTGQSHILTIERRSDKTYKLGDN